MGITTKKLLCTHPKIKSSYTDEDQKTVQRSFCSVFPFLLNSYCQWARPIFLATDIDAIHYNAPCISNTQHLFTMNSLRCMHNTHSEALSSHFSFLQGKRLAPSLHLLLIKSSQKLLCFYGNPTSFHRYTRYHRKYIQQECPNSWFHFILTL